MSFLTKDYEQALEQAKQGTTKSGKLSLEPDDFDFNLTADVQTDKKMAKLLPCRECKRPLVVTTFFAPAKALCNECAGTSEGGVATIGQPTPGQTEPTKAVDLTKVLVNPNFAHARCPVHPDDDEHEMKLITVTHNDNYGPGFLYEQGGKLKYQQTAIGETVMLQCQQCLATVSYSTTAVTKFRPMNDTRKGTGVGVNTWKHYIESDDPEPIKGPVAA